MRAMWLTLRKKFIGALTLAGLTLTALAGAAFQWFLPAKACHYWLCIPVFFYFVGLMYIGMVSFFCRWGADKLLGGYLLCKALKFALSLLLVLAYAFVVKVEVVAFLFTFLLFFFGFLVFETRFFLVVEANLKNRKKNENDTLHSDAVAAGAGRTGAGGSC